MTSYLNRWTAMGVWIVFMGVVWVRFVPGAVSAISFAVLVVTGLVAVIALSALWRSQQPVPSVGQRREEVEEAEAATQPKK